MELRRGSKKETPKAKRPVTVRHFPQLDVRSYQIHARSRHWRETSFVARLSLTDAEVMEPTSSRPGHF